MSIKHSFKRFMCNTLTHTPNMEIFVMEPHEASDQSSCLENYFPITEWTKAWLVLRELKCDRY